MQIRHRNFGVTHVPWHEMVDGTDSSDKDELVDLLSVAIDIGTTTTHLRFFSAFAARSEGAIREPLSIRRRTERYRSPITLTPYQNETSLDGDELEDFVVQCYRTAGYHPDDIDTGAVIITGEACRTRNAEAIASMFSERAGDFVCAMAGPNLEAVMAAHGSGAVDLAVETKNDILHLDIGGGTTEFALIHDGFVEETASIRIGARLIELTEGGEVVRLHDGAQHVVDGLPFDVNPGVTLTDDQRRAFAELLARHIVDVIEGHRPAEVEPLLNTEFPVFSTFDVVTCSGGVSEYVYGRAAAFYGDLGPDLGKSIRRRLDETGYPLEQTADGIRATVSGTAQHGFQVSGNAITLTDEATPALKNVPIVPFVVDEDDDTDMVTEQFREKLAQYDVDTFDEPFAFGIHLHGAHADDFYETLASALVEGWRWAGSVPPLIVVSDSELGGQVADPVSNRIDRAAIAIDVGELDQFGYLDISDTREDIGGPMVTMKSLDFQQPVRGDPRSVPENQ